MFGLKQPTNQVEKPQYTNDGALDVSPLDDITNQLKTDDTLKRYIGYKSYRDGENLLKYIVYNEQTREIEYSHDLYWIGSYCNNINLKTDFLCLQKAVCDITNEDAQIATKEFANPAEIKLLRKNFCPTILNEP